MVLNIWIAAADNQRKVVESYIESGDLTPNAKDPNGYTPIHAAASYGHINLLQYLIEQGGDINIQDNEGDTPLHHVEDVKTAKYLIEELKANDKIKNSDGLTAAKYIEDDDEFPEVAQYLLSLAYDKPSETSEANHNSSSILDSLPAAGTIDGHEIRYSMENEPETIQDQLSPEEKEERRKKLEAILESENPEEGLRDLVRNAVREGLSQYKEENSEVELGSSSKRRKE